MSQDQSAGEARVESSAAMQLTEERKKREDLERRVQELVEENRRRRQESEAAERETRIREALQAKGVAKTKIAQKVIQDDVRKDERGSYYGEWNGERVTLDEYLDRFVSENPEFLPPRIAGGAGSLGGARSFGASGLDMESIRPGMSREDLHQAWKEVARLMGSS